MRNWKGAALAVGLFSLTALGHPGAAVSGEVTVKLSVPDMNCLACPITVRRSLEQVDGVIRAEAFLETKTAVVVFDDTRTSTKALTEATEWYGYPSTVLEGDG